MKPQDLTEAAAVWWRSSLAAAPRPDHPTLDAMVRRLEAERWCVILAWRDARILALLAMELQEGWLRQLFVDPPAQGQGVGAALLAKAKGLMPTGFFLNTDVANAAARRFYEARGLRLEGVAPHPRWGNLQARYVWSPRGQ